MIKLLKKLTKKDMALAGLAFLLILAQVYLNLTMPDYMSDMTVLVQTEGSAMADILAAGGKMLLCAVGSLLTAACIAVCAAKISANFSANLRGQVFNRVQSFSMEEIGRFSTSSLITRSTNDITQVQMVLVLGLEVFLKAPVTAVWAICKIAGKSWQWTATTGIAVIILLCIVGTCVMVAMPKFRKLQILTDNINRVTRENLTGLRVVRAYNAEDYQETKFEKANDELKRTQLFANRTMTILMPGIMLVMNGLLGEFAHSKLFTNVRENAGIAYSVSSQLDLFSGLLRMYAGIDRENRNQARKMMNHQLLDLKKGNFTDFELEQTKEVIRRSLLIAQDNQQTLVERAYLNALFGKSSFDIDRLVAKLESVDKEAVCKAANSLKLQAIYFMEGVE